jgi:hypothetical protein
MKFAIFDWAGNRLKTASNGLWVDFDFETFEDAWEYIYVTFQGDDYQELDVREV